jgi:hypothetical protein
MVQTSNVHTLVHSNAPMFGRLASKPLLGLCDLCDLGRPQAGGVKICLGLPASRPFLVVKFSSAGRDATLGTGSALHATQEGIVIYLCRKCAERTRR